MKAFFQNQFDVSVKFISNRIIRDFLQKSGEYKDVFTIKKFEQMGKVK